MSVWQWLGVLFAVWACFVAVLVTLLCVATSVHGRSRRRGGYLPPRAYGSMSRATGPPAATSTVCRTAGGSQGAKVIPLTPRVPNRTTGHGGFTNGHSGTTGTAGHRGNAAPEPPDPAACSFQAIWDAMYPP